LRSGLESDFDQGVSEGIVAGGSQDSTAADSAAGFGVAGRSTG
jgi:hypothetical protein